MFEIATYIHKNIMFMHMCMYVFLKPTNNCNRGNISKGILLSAKKSNQNLSFHDIKGDTIHSLRHIYWNFTMN